MIPKTLSSEFNFWVAENTSHVTLEDVVIWVSEQFNPDEVFLPESLNEWAKQNGYVKK